MERVYRAMRNVGVCNIAVGTVILSVGVSVGVMAIVSGAILLKRKSEIVF